MKDWFNNEIVARIAEHPKRAAVAIFLGACAGDYADYESTKYALRRGIGESNPLMDYVIRRWGFEGFRSVKLLMGAYGAFKVARLLRSDDESKAFRYSLGRLFPMLLTWLVALFNVVHATRNGGPVRRDD